MIRSLLLALACLSILADPLPADRHMDWDQSGVDFTGIIPLRTNIWKTYTTNDTAATINSDLSHNSGHSNSVALLTAGRYYFSGNIDPNPSASYAGSGLTIRGEGMGQTVLCWLTNTTFLEAPMEFRTVGRASSPQTNAGYIFNWTSGYAKGSTNITVDHAESNPETYGHLKVGTVVVFDQLQDLDGVGFNSLGWDGVGVNNGFEYPGVELFRGGSLRTNLDMTVDRIAGPDARIQMQFAVVTSITDGTNLTIWPPIQMTNWNVLFSPQMWIWGDSVEYVGVENLTIDCKLYDSPGVVSTYVQDGNTYTNYLPHFFGIFFQGAKFCWATNVEVLSPKSGMISTYGGIGFQFDHNYQHEQRVVPDGGAPGNYGIDLKYESFSRVQDNIFNGITSPIVPDNGASFTVYAGNYPTNCIFVSDGNNWMSHAIQSHGAGAHGNLFEFNEGSGINFDYIHGESAANSVIHRNRWLGQHEGNANKTSDTFPILIMATNRNVSVIGNVLGTVGYHNTYEYTVLDAFFSDFAKSIYRIGHWGNNAVQNEGDPLTLSTLIRTMNFDTVTSTNGGVRIDQSLNTNLVTSYYLASRPGWWDTNSPYPPIGPDLSPMYSKIPARLRFESGVLNSGGGSSSSSTSTAKGSGVLKSAGNLRIK